MFTLKNILSLFCITLICPTSSDEKTSVLKVRIIGSIFAEILTIIFPGMQLDVVREGQNHLQFKFAVIRYHLTVHKIIIITHNPTWVKTVKSLTWSEAHNLMECHIQLQLHRQWLYLHAENARRICSEFRPIINNLIQWSNDPMIFYCWLELVSCLTGCWQGKYWFVHIVAYLCLNRWYKELG